MGDLESVIIDNVHLHRRAAKVEAPVEVGVQVFVGEEVFPGEADVFAGYRVAGGPFHAPAHVDGVGGAIRAGLPALEDVRYDGAQVDVRIVQQSLGVPVVVAEEPGRVGVDHAHLAAVNADGIPAAYHQRVGGQTLVNRRQAAIFHQVCQHRGGGVPGKHLNRDQYLLRNHLFYDNRGWSWGFFGR